MENPIPKSPLFATPAIEDIHAYIERSSNPSECATVLHFVLNWAHEQSEIAMQNVNKIAKELGEQYIHEAYEMGLKHGRARAARKED